MSRITITLCGNRAVLRQAIDAEWEKSDYVFIDAELPEKVAQELAQLIMQAETEEDFWKAAIFLYNNIPRVSA
jgi:hypothetical protein